MTHCSMEQLLDLRDDPSGPGSEHLSQCPECQRERRRLIEVRHGLRTLAPLGLPAHARLSRSPQSLTRRPLILSAGLALAAGLVLAVAWGASRWSSESAPSLGLLSLRERSRALEQEWRARKDVTVDAHSAGQLLHLEDVLGFIDAALPRAEGREAEVLWRARVQTLESLIERSAVSAPLVSL